MALCFSTPNSLRIQSKPGFQPRFSYQPNNLSSIKGLFSYEDSLQKLSSSAPFPDNMFHQNNRTKQEREKYRIYNIQELETKKMNDSQDNSERKFQDLIAMKQIKSEQKGRELSEMKLIDYLRNSTIPILLEVTKVNSMVLIKNTAKQIKISRYQIYEEHTKM